MKKILVLAFLITTLIHQNFAQETPFFEGTLNYKVELKGPQASMLLVNKPNTQLQMHIKEGNYITNLKGGQYPKTFLFVADSNWEYSVNFSSKVIYKHSAYTDRLRKELKEKKTRPKVLATGQVGIVKDIECDIYRVKVDDTYFTYYVSDEYRVNLDAFPKDIRARPFFMVAGLEGRIPLKVIKKQKGLTVIQEITSVKAREFSPKQFQVPPDLAFKIRDYRH